MGLTTYVITTEVQQFIKYLSLPWPDHFTPYLELNIHIGLVGAAGVLLCFFFGAAVFKIGNYANDGYRLGVQEGVCSRDPPPLPGAAGGIVRAAWLHGGPTGPFVHILVAHLLIMARLIMEAAGTKAMILPKSTVWWSELSRVLPQKDRLAVFNVIAALAGSSDDNSSTQGPVAAPYEASTSVTFQAAELSDDDLRDDLGDNDWHVGEIPWGPFSPHFLNYLLAHLIYAGRYAGVFWGTNKGLGFVFFVQLILNAGQSIFALNGFQVLYKVHVVGPKEVLPDFDGFLLPLPAIFAVFTASQALVLASGSVLYLYGFVKFNAFLNAEKEKYHILKHKNLNSGVVYTVKVYLKRQNVARSGGLELSRVLPRKDHLAVFTSSRLLAGSRMITLRSSKRDTIISEARYSLVLLSRQSSRITTFATNRETTTARRGDTLGPFSPHFLNYLLAHLIYAGRYAWGLLAQQRCRHSARLLRAADPHAGQSVFALNGFQVRWGWGGGGVADFDGSCCPAGYLRRLHRQPGSSCIASGSVLYLYGFVKFNAFLNAEKEKYHILSKHGHQTPWSYWPHCWGLTVLVVMTASAAPLVHDWTIMYRTSLDASVLAATISTIFHLFLWILLWMALTVKSKWYFKLRVQISKTIVTNTHSIRLVNEVQLSKQVEDTEGPVMVIGAGKTYLLQEGSPKRSLMKLVMHTVTEKKARGEEEEIYWLRPKPPPGGSESWNKRKHSPGAKHKVTFDDTPSTSRKRDSGRGNLCPDVLHDLSDSDTSDSDGDYARLRDVSFPGPTRRLSHKEEPKEEDRPPPQDLSFPESDSVPVGGDFPAPPPELTDPAHYPPPPTTPPPSHFWRKRVPEPLSGK
ncbi:uncharacterized protein LOC119578425 [Penaeus monodon]|uniref:uncharacterized protein LOC119578425 n=1 Tax=Penaeus monodon TaxID=6687 RepID=UPI0018A76966|nr:uncharacterized protein LOC119578425 [Penaeus monodon]